MRRHFKKSPVKGKQVKRKEKLNTSKRYTRTMFREQPKYGYRKESHRKVKENF